MNEGLLPSPAGDVSIPGDACKYIKLNCFWIQILLKLLCLAHVVDINKGMCVSITAEMLCFVESGLDGK